MKTQSTIIIASFFISIMLISCAENKAQNTLLNETFTNIPAPTETLTPSSTVTITPPPRINQTPSPSPTNRPTFTPTEQSTYLPTKTETLTAYPTKSIFLERGLFGGDGGYTTDHYLGRDTPDFVLYTDGELLVRDGKWYREAMLSQEQICTLLSNIEKTGFLDIEATGYEDKDNSPIYQFDETTQYSDGDVNIIILVNGSKPKRISIYKLYYEYLIDPVRKMDQLLMEYRLDGGARYNPKWVILWIEQGKGLAASTDIPQAWLDDLPPLSEYWNRGEPSQWEEGIQVVVEEENKSAVMQLFNYEMTGRLFTEEGQEYYLIIRPLLPHETPLEFSEQPSWELTNEVLFSCSR
jgi:hypothetical protein